MAKGRIKILSVGADRLTQKQALEKIGLFLSSEKGHHVVTLNSEMAVQAEKDAELREAVNSADLVVADGMGILQAASFIQARSGRFWTDAGLLFCTWLTATFFPQKVRDALPEKISGIDLLSAICASPFMEGRSVYLLGAEEGIAEQAGKALEKAHPLLWIAGAEAGLISSISSEDNAQLLQRINAASPDVLFVALGVPKQEKWIRANLERMPSVRIAMGVGGAFDVIAGKLPRAPRWMQERGLEWLWRLGLQPRRLPRIFNATLRFSWLIFRRKADKME
jgi:N-acetylglucosaminyldiphosphoundecaprenol N-acetyl-beta-D-mannosaminyltransferase